MIRLNIKKVNLFWNIFFWDTEFKGNPLNEHSLPGFYFLIEEGIKVLSRNPVVHSS